MKWWQNEYVALLITAYENVTTRERNIILLTVLSLISLIIYMLAIEPMFVGYKALAEESSNLDRKNRQIESQLETTLANKRQDPNIQLQQEINRLENKSLMLDKDIGRLTKSLVAPKQMVSLLEGVLKSDREIKLISFVNLPKEDVELSLDVSNKKNVSDNGIKNELKIDEGLIYKHSFEIEMRSTYGSTLSYLKRIDKLPWKVFWQDLRYEVGEYPYGTLKIKIYTLSTSKEVLGV